MTTRREFISGCGKVISGAALSSLVIPVLQSCTPTSLPLTPSPDPPPVGADGRVSIDVADLNASNPLKSMQGLYGSDENIGYRFPGAFELLSARWVSG
jgi:hypothetical protein